VRGTVKTAPKEKYISFVLFNIVLEEQNNKK
jgi:hypothetical protein